MKNYTESIFRRTSAIFAAMVLAAAGLVGQLSRIVASDDLAQTAQAQSKYTLTVADERGLIYDCRMQPLVATQQRWRTAVFPTPQNQQKVLDAVEPERRAAVAELLETGKPFVTETTKAVQADMVYSFSVPERYTENQTAVHLIGYLDYTGSGVTGIEKECDSLLSGSGQQIEVTGVLNALQQTIAGIEPEVTVNGSGDAGVVLTLDRRIQQIVESVGSRMLDKGAIVVLDPYNGQIRAMASFPAYSPLHLDEAVGDEVNKPMLNRALLGYSVGSTFKIVTAAAAMETLGREYCLTRKYTCEGAVDVYGQVFRCHLRSGHGELDMFDAMRESCNPWFIGLGQETGGEQLLNTARQVGFGESMMLYGDITASGGTLPSEDSLQAPAAVANFSFGQGELTASPVQIARMTAAVVNGGKLVSPTLVLGTTDDGRTLQASALPVSRQALSEEITAQLKVMLAYAVMSDDSSGARPELVTAGGKTATAQTGQYDEEGNELEQGWFTGFFPADQPQYVVTVLAENEGFGNTSAAPVFAAIADAVCVELGLAADDGTEEQQMAE